MAKYVVACSSLKKTEQKVDKATGAVTTVESHLNVTTVDGVRFWSNEKLSAGTAVELTARKAGDKYLKDGIECTVRQDGYNFDGAIGTSVDINAINDTQAALLAMAM